METSTRKLNRVSEKEFRCQYATFIAGTPLERDRRISRGGVVLNVGCGPKRDDALHLCFHADNWSEIRLDINPACNPDIVANVTDMSAVDGQSVDAVWSSHNLEHLYDHEVHAALLEFARVLRPRGFVLVSVPDAQEVCREVAERGLDAVLYNAEVGDVSALDVLYGWRKSVASGNEYMSHKIAFDADSLGRRFLQAGFRKVVAWSKEFNLWAMAEK